MEERNAVFVGLFLHVLRLNQSNSTLRAQMKDVLQNGSCLIEFTSTVRQFGLLSEFLPVLKDALVAQLMAKAKLSLTKISDVIRLHPQNLQVSGNLIDPIFFSGNVLHLSSVCRETLNVLADCFVSLGDIPGVSMLELVLYSAKQFISEISGATNDPIFRAALKAWGESMAIVLTECGEDKLDLRRKCQHGKGILTGKMEQYQKLTVDAVDLLTPNVWRMAEVDSIDLSLVLEHSGSKNMDPQSIAQLILEKNPLKKTRRFSLRRRVRSISMPKLQNPKKRENPFSVPVASGNEPIRYALQNSRRGGMFSELAAFLEAAGGSQLSDPYLRQLLPDSRTESVAMGHLENQLIQKFSKDVFHVVVLPNGSLQSTESVIFVLDTHIVVFKISEQTTSLMFCWELRLCVFEPIPDNLVFSGGLTVTKGPQVFHLKMSVTDRSWLINSLNKTK